MVAAARPAPGPPRPYHFPSFESSELANGSKLIVCPIPKLPLATLMAVTTSGTSSDPSGLEGVARMTAKMLSEGAGSRTGSELAEKLEKLGTSLETGADWDSSIAKVTFLAGHLAELIEVLGDVLLEPTFPERELLRLKAERIADLLQIESEPRALADESFESFLYTAESRFSVQSGGAKDSVERIRRDDVLDFYSSAYSPANTTFIAVGDLNRDEVAHLISGRFAKWRATGTSPKPRPNALAYASRRLTIVEKEGAPQSELRVGHEGLPRKHPGYFPAVVMNAILGGLFGSRINLNLREAHGYTYGASSYFDWRKDAGPFVISTAVATEVTAAALREILLEIDKIRGEPVTESELSLAKDYLDGVFPIRYEATSAVASALASLIIHELPSDFYDNYRANIQAVTSDDVLQAARRFLQPEKLQTLIVGNDSAIRDSVSQLEFGAA